MHGNCQSTEKNCSWPPSSQAPVEIFHHRSREGWQGNDAAPCRPGYTRHLWDMADHLGSRLLERSAEWRLYSTWRTKKNLEVEVALLLILDDLEL